MAVLWGKAYSRVEILRRVGDIRQLARVEPFELVDGSERGVRAVRVRNGGGLDLTIIQTGAWPSPTWLSRVLRWPSSRGWGWRPGL